MKKYIQKLQAERTPHERRQLATQVAGVITAVLFVGWLGTLGLRIGSGGTVPSDTSGAAAALVAVQAASSTSTALPGYYGN